MKKSFKRSIAVILSVLMVIASLPFTALAASGEYHPNAVMQYGTIFDYNAGDTLHSDYITDAGELAMFSALKGPALDMNDGTLSISEAKSQEVADNTGCIAEDYTYGVGDYFTATVRVDNISQLAAFSMAVSYSDSIEPAGVYTADGEAAFYGLSDEVPEGATINYAPGVALDFASVNTVYPGINGGLVGELSYINTEDGYIMAQAAATDGSDSVDVSEGTDSAEFTDPATGEAGYTYAGQVPVATFMFKIVSDDPIEFSIFDADNTKLPQYTGGFYVANDADGTSVEDYTTYATLADAQGSTLLTLGGENENNMEVGETYTITFKSYDGTVISSKSYKEGATVTVPALPTKAADDTYHYSVAWNTVPSATADADAEYTAVATPVAHTFDAGVVDGSEKVFTCSACSYEKREEIKECTHNWVATGNETVITPATCKATGTKSVEYKCSLCQETKTETEVINKTSHAYGDYVYNEDATYTSSSVHTDGTATATCSICGDKVSKTIAGTGLLRVNTVSLTPGAAITLSAGIDKTRVTPFDSASCVMTYNKADGTNTVVAESEITDLVQSPSNTARWTYDFDCIAPQYFGDEVAITMYGVKDGISCKGHTVNYSVMKYCNTTSKRATSSTYPIELKKLCVEILYYGEMDRIYRNNKTSVSPISELTATETALHGNDVPTYVNYQNAKQVEIANPEITWKSITLSLTGSVRPKYKFEYPNTASLSDYVFRFDVNGTTYEMTYEEDEDQFEDTTTTAAGKKAAYIYCDKIMAYQFNLPVDLTVVKNGVDVSNTFRYSVESYATKSAYTSGTAELKALVDQMLRYGRASAAYKNR